MLERASLVVREKLNFNFNDEGLLHETISYVIFMVEALIHMCP